MTDNVTRREQARRALACYAQERHTTEEPDQENLTDLLTDLRHLFGEDFERAVLSSAVHYEAER